MSYSLSASAAGDATTAPSFSPAHFRNCYLAPLALAPDRVPRDDLTAPEKADVVQFSALRAKTLWRRFGEGANGLNSTRTKKLAAPAVILLLSASLSATAFAQTASHPPAKVHKASHHTSKKSHKPRGQQAIDGDRARQIQDALIRERYMTGEPSGRWDDSTQVAMRRYQADQGWQSKSIPDSRALIRLGLGPNHVHLLNPESAMVSEPQLSGRARAVTPVSARRSVPAQPPVAAPAVAVPAISPTR